MSILAKLLVQLGIESSGFSSGLKSAEKDVTGSLDRIANAGADMQDVGKKLTFGLTTPLVGMGIAGVSAASNLSESLNKMNVVFGDSSGQIETWSKSAATSLGMSQQQALEATGTFGNLFTAMGVGQDESAGLSTNLVQMAADLASFNNIDPGLALEKLRAGMVGEVEPLRTLGVNLSAAAVKAKAMELGLADANGELSNAALIQARYALIMDQTKNAQGDFIRTSDGLANSTRIGKAQLADAAAVLGKNLLPFVTKATQFVNQLVTGFANLSPETQKVILVVAGLAAAAGPLLMVVGGLASAFAAVAPFLPAIGAGIAAIAGPVAIVIGVIAALAAAWSTNFLGIRDKAAEVWAAIQPIFQSIVTWLQTNIPLAIQAVVGWWNNSLMPALRTAWSWIQANLVPLLQAIGNVLSAVIGVAVTALAGLWQKVLLPALQTVGAYLAETFGPALSALGAFINDTLAPILRDMGANVLPIIKGAFDGIGNAIQTVIGFLNSMAEKIRNLKLPSWLTPGSPTPFEMGLRGIGQAMRDLTGVQLPAFEAGLQLAPAGAVAGGGRAQTTANTWAITINAPGGNPDAVRRAVEDGVVRAQQRARGLR